MTNLQYQKAGDSVECDIYPTQHSILLIISALNLNDFLSTGVQDSISKISKKRSCLRMKCVNWWASWISKSLRCGLGFEGPFNESKNFLEQQNGQKLCHILDYSVIK